MNKKQYNNYKTTSAKATLCFLLLLSFFTFSALAAPSPVKAEIYQTALLANSAKPYSNVSIYSVRKTASDCQKAVQFSKLLFLNLVRQHTSRINCQFKHHSGQGSFRSPFFILPHIKSIPQESDNASGIIS